MTGLGPKSNVDANRMIFNFFAQHPLPRYIDINANLQLDAVHEVDKVDTDTSSSIFPVVLLSFAIVASIMLALVVFKMVSVRSYSPPRKPECGVVTRLTVAKARCQNVHAAVVLKPMLQLFRRIGFRKESLGAI